MGFKLAISGPSSLIAVVRSVFSAHRLNVLPNVSGRVAKIFPKVCTTSQIPQPTPPPPPPKKPHPLQQRVHASYIQLELSY